MDRQRDGRRGCVLRSQDDETAQLGIPLVTPAGRGAGPGRQLVDRTVEFARAAGYRRMVPSNDPLAAARRIYLSGASDWLTKNTTAVSAPNSSDRITPRSDASSGDRAEEGIPLVGGELTV